MCGRLPEGLDKDRRLHRAGCMEIIVFIDQELLSGAYVFEGDGKDAFGVFAEFGHDLIAKTGGVDACAPMAVDGGKGMAVNGCEGMAVNGGEGIANDGMKKEDKKDR